MLSVEKAYMHRKPLSTSSRTGMFGTAAFWTTIGLTTPTMDLIGFKLKPLVSLKLYRRRSVRAAGREFLRQIT